MSGPPLAEQAYRRLRAAITAQRLEPGAPLSENDVARALGVSRTPVREALSRLELEGFARRVENGRLKVVRLTRDQIRDLFELRSLLEGYATRLAAERISDDELARLDAIIEQDAQALGDDDIKELGDHNRRIHDVMAEASRNRVLVELVADLRQRLIGLTAFAVGDRDERARFVADHAELTRLLRASDGQRAAALVRNHLEAARDLLLSNMQEDSSDRGPDGLARLLQPMPDLAERN